LQFIRAGACFVVVGIKQLNIEFGLFQLVK